ncbi:MAG: thioredoxin family protein [Planctomycetota bacterium]
MVRTTCLLMGLMIVVAPVQAQYHTAAEAIRASARTGKPIFSIATSPTCPPCRAMKHTLQTDPEVKSLLEDFVVLEMDASSDDFAAFMQRYQGEYFGVPMVHVVSSEGELMYGRSGGLAAAQLQQLLGYAREPQLPVGGAPDAGETLAAAKSAAARGELATALTEVMPIARQASESRETQVARAYRDQLEVAITRWIGELQRDMARESSRHSAAYRLAKLFTELPQESTARTTAQQTMSQLEREEQTRVAMLQAKELVRARYDEETKQCARAIARYEATIQLGSDTPSAEYARNRIPVVRERENLKLTAAP